MTTKTVDNIISKSIQEIANDYVASKANPIALRENGIGQKTDAQDPTDLKLVFGQKHNDIECALCPSAKRACDRAWFSAKQVENWSKMSKTTLWRWLERLEKARRIASVSDMKQTSIQDSIGVPHETTLYNLNVLNQLAMACIDNEKLNDVSCKFSDMLSEKEAEMLLGAQAQPQVPLPTTYLEALKALVASEEEKEAALKALTAEKEAHEQDNRDFQAYTDILNRKKMQISSKREAEAMGRLSNIRYREQDLQASVKMTAYGHPSRNKKFTTQNVMDAVWFQQTFKASTSEAYFNGNPAWKPEVRALKALLTKRANERASIDLENRFHDILTKTKAKTVLKLWMRAKEGGTPFHESMHEISLGGYTNDIACALSSMVELHDKYEYRRSNGDYAYGMVYSYCYDIWARVLMSLGTREIADYLRDGIDIEEFANTIYSVQSECFGLHE